MSSVQQPKPHGAPIREKRLLPVQPPGQAIGRNRELASMHVQIKAGGSLMLHGPAGIGKTALATVLATAQIASNPSGVLWFTLAEDDLIALATRVGRAYNTDTFTGATGDWSKVSAQVRDLLKQNRPLIVLDGIVDTNSAREFVRQCAPTTPFIVIGERAVPGPWTPIELKPLTSKESQAVFRLYSGMGETGNTNDIEALAEFLNGYPLTLELAGRACAVNALSAGEFLASLPSGGGVSTQQTVMSAVFKRLDTVVQGVMLVLAASPTGSVGVELLSMASRLAPADALAQARKLVARGLAHEYISYGQVRFALHDVAYQFARNWLSSYQRLAGIEGRVMQSVLAYAERHADSDVPQRTVAHDRLAEEMENIVGVAAFAADRGRGEILKRLVTALEEKADDLILERHFWLELDQIKRLAELVSEEESVAPPVVTPPPPPPPIVAAPTLPPPLPTPPSVTLTVAAPVPVEPPLAPPEPLKLSTLLTPPLPEPPAELPPMPMPEATQPAPSLTLSSLFSTPTQPTRPVVDIAAPPLETIAEVPPLRVDDDDADTALGTDTEALAGDTERHTPPSIATIREMLHDARDKGDKRREALLLQSLGQHNMDMGRVPDAVAYFKEALAAFETVNDSEGMLATLDVLASLSSFTGNAQEALLFATRGVNFAQQVNDKSRLGKLMLRLGDIRLAHGDLPSATDTFQQAVETLRGTDEWVAVGVAMTKLGRAYLQGQQAEQARHILEAALSIFRKERRADHEARALGELGRVYTSLSEWSKAEDHHEEALTLAREQFDQATEAEQFAAIGYLRELMNDREGAILFYRRALHTAYLVNDSKLQVACAIQLGEFMVEDTRTLNQAVQLLREANEKAPSAAAERLLKRAEQRLKRASSAGLNIPPAEASNRDFAAKAYVA